MSDTQAQFSVLRQTADPAVVDAISQLIEKGEDHELNRINLLDFSARTGLDEEKVISGLPACSAARAVRSHLECAVPRLRRRARRAQHPEIAAARRLQLRAMRCRAMRPRSTNASKSPSPSVPASGASPRMIPIRCRSGNITADVLELGDGPERGIDRAADRRGVARGHRTAGGREGGAVAAIAQSVRDRVRAGDAFGAFSRCPGRADPRAPAVLHRLQQAACADRHHRDASRAVAAVARKSDRHAGAAVGLGRRRHASSSCSASASRS